MPWNNDERLAVFRYCAKSHLEAKTQMPRRRRVYTPATIENIRILAGQGKSASEIAAAIGSTAASVRVKCSELKIKLVRRGQPRHGQVYNPTSVETIRRLAGQGKSAAEIASVIGSTAASVRVKCCELKIKLTSRGRPSSARAHDQKLTLFMPSSVCDALAQKGATVRKSAAELARQLLEAIVHSNIYEAVLDEDVAAPVIAPKHCQ